MRHSISLGDVPILVAEDDILQAIDIALALEEAAAIVIGLLILADVVGVTAGFPRLDARPAQAR